MQKFQVGQTIYSVEDNHVVSSVVQKVDEFTSSQLDDEGNVISSEPKYTYYINRYVNNVMVDSQTFLSRIDAELWFSSKEALSDYLFQNIE